MIQKLIVVFLVNCFLIDGHTTIHPLWAQWKSKFDKSYHPTEELRRQEIWTKNLESINAHNLRFQMGLESWEQGLNQFSDLTWDEFKDQHLMDEDMKLISKSNVVADQHIDVSQLPESIDWRTKGYVTSVKNQGGCGSCWAFSTAGTLEGQYKNQTGTLTSLAPQQFVDCTVPPKYHCCWGCNGGEPVFAVMYAKDVGAMPETAYPYKGVQGKCEYDESKTIFKNSGHIFNGDGNEPYLQKIVAEYGPASVMIEVVSGFGSYKSGVYSTNDCTPWRCNHAVLVVGYGAEDNKDYWLVKNSWSPWWGDQGYIKMARNHDNMCNIARWVLIPLIKK